MTNQRKETIKLLREILRRIENENYKLRHNYGYDCELPNNCHLTAPIPDTYSITFTGSKTPTPIPEVLIVWPNGDYEKRPYTQIRGVNRDEQKPTYMYCPIKISQIKPETHRNKMKTFFCQNDIDWMMENVK